MAAAAFKLDNLTGFVDLNRIQATGPTREIFDIPEIERKWAAFGWEVASVDGHDVGQILSALKKSQETKGRPTVIVAETVKGKGFSFAENNAAFHNGALTAEQHRQALSELEARRAEMK